MRLRLAERLRQCKERVVKVKSSSRHYWTRAMTTTTTTTSTTNHRRIPLAWASSVSDVLLTTTTPQQQLSCGYSSSDISCFMDQQRTTPTTTLEQKITQSLLTSLLPSSIAAQQQEQQQQEVWRMVPQQEQEEQERRRPMIIAGNWKCNPSTIEEATALLKDIAAASYPDDQEVVIFPPMAYLGLALEYLKDTKIQVGCQTISSIPDASGAYTGEVTSRMVKSMGCSYVMIGHSERRTYFGEDNEDIQAKIQSVLKEGNLNIILCVGETQEEYEFHLTSQVLKQQIQTALQGVSPQDVMDKIVIAYEPVWAIGTGKVATPSYAQKAHDVIRQTLSELYNNNTQIAQQVRIQYGGSVNPSTIQALMDQPSIDGALVGGASLTFDTFHRIVQQSIPSSSSSVKTTTTHSTIAFTNPFF